MSYDAASAPRPPVDLARLATASQTRASYTQRPSAVAGWRRRWRGLITVAALSVATVAFAAYLVPLLVPPTFVAVAPIILPTAEAAVRRSSSALQATGWVEPEPRMVRLAAQLPGLITELPIVEGSRLVAGETVVARLDATVIEREVAEAAANARVQEARVARLGIEYDRARALAERNLAARLRAAELGQARAMIARQQGLLGATVDATRAVLEQNANARQFSRQAEHARAAAALAITRLETQLESLRARVPAIRERATAHRAMVAQNALTELDAIDAEAELASAIASVAGLTQQIDAALAVESRAAALLAVAQDRVAEPAVVRAQLAQAQADLAGIPAQLEALDARLELARLEAEDALALRTAAGVAAARLDEARAERDAAVATRELAVARQALHTVYAPIDGIVSAVVAFEGGRIGGESIIHRIGDAYDPTALQVRVDLPLADVPAVRIGQEVEVTTQAVPGVTYAGVVTRWVPAANLARNSQQVKVRILHPDERLVPDMLTRCRFLPIAPPEVAADTRADAAPIDVGNRRHVPASSLVRGPAGTAVFVYDPRGLLDREGRARRVEVVELPDAAAPTGYVEVEGLFPIGARAILNPTPDLRDGDRVAVRPAASSPQPREP